MFRLVLRRIAALITGSLLIFSVGIFAANAAEGSNTATLSDVSCQAEQGTVTATLTADSTATQDVEFILLVDNTSTDDLVIPVAPGQSKDVPVSNLDDGTHRIEVMAGEQTILDANFEVTCDPAPVEPYSNPKASAMDLCESVVMVRASNYPIQNNLEGLQPVHFVIGAVGPNGNAVALPNAEFHLPSGDDDAFDSEWTFQFPQDTGTYQVTVSANGNVIASVPVLTNCHVVPNQPVPIDEEPQPIPVDPAPQPQPQAEQDDVVIPTSVPAGLPSTGA